MKITLSELRGLIREAVADAMGGAVTGDALRDAFIEVATEMGHTKNVAAAAEWTGWDAAAASVAPIVAKMQDQMAREATRKRGSYKVRHDALANIRAALAWELEPDRGGGVMMQGAVAAYTAELGLMIVNSAVPDADPIDVGPRPFPR